MDCLVLQARHAIAAEVDFLQVRERDLEAKDLVRLVADLVALARGTQTAVLVNDRVDVAIACGAAGVHLRADSVPADGVRAIAPPGFVIGRSVHSVAEAVAAQPCVDYLIAGAVWPSASKAAGHPTLGPGGFSDIAAAVRVPVLAVGGVTLDRMADIARAGGTGAAAIGLFMSAGTVRESCRAIPLRDTVEAARRLFDSVQSAS
jgi:thiamine-phosphate pyrophosphorylase